MWHSDAPHKGATQESHRVSVEGTFHSDERGGVAVSSDDILAGDFHQSSLLGPNVLLHVVQFYSPSWWLYTVASSLPFICVTIAAIAAIIAVALLSSIRTQQNRKIRTRASSYGLLGGGKSMYLVYYFKVL